ncbi:hypothetical protein HDE74_001849 [Janthinobacterium sp. K2Li3]|nr:hypothetical protein [Janthinobacterium sp. K2C7]MBB5381136.1 hypothetical protein [Janthinobacterium sp. K2Li3]MBB5387711.1 hypothetical protein [Janthinobacterium sp. K2E3]
MSENSRLYLNAIGWTDATIDSQEQMHFNVIPGTYVPVLRLNDNQPHLNDTFWSCRPAWAAAAKPTPGKKKIPIAFNACVEKLADAYWKPLLRAGRGIVCASGWYEWTGERATSNPGTLTAKTVSRCSCSRSPTSGHSRKTARKRASSWSLRIQSGAWSTFTTAGPSPSAPTTRAVGSIPS